MQSRLVRRQIAAILPQERNALAVSQYTKPERSHPKLRRPLSTAAGDQHATSAPRWPPALEQRLILTVVKDQQPRECTLPLSQHQLECHRRIAHRRMAGSDLAGDALGLLKAEPDHAAGEVLPVAVDELVGQ